MPSNYYRSDGWVKLVSGQALSGAQIYVCTQPANVTPPVTPKNTTPVPWAGPNPQALIYSDNGLTSITQPIISDGFGHYDFYALPGLYTLVIMYGGKVYASYVDQSLGNVGTSLGTSVLFETNGSPNFNQTLQNLVQGSGITIATDNFGNTTITSTAGGLSLKTNSVANGSQSILNLKNGTSIGIVDDGVGGVTVTNTAPAVSLSASATGPFFIGPGILSSQSLAYSSGGGLTASQGANAIRVAKFVLPVSMTIARCSIYVTSAITHTGCSFGVYSSDGSTRVLYSGVFASATLGIQTNTFTSVVIPAGTYWFAQTDANTGAGAYNVYLFNAGMNSFLYGASSVKYMGTSTSTSSGGVLPASIVVTGLTSDGDNTIAAALWESQ